MRHEGVLSVRLPNDLLDAIELERRHASRVAGVDVKTSAMVRAILERDLKRRRRKVRAQQLRAQHRVGESA